MVGGGMKLGGLRLGETDRLLPGTVYTQVLENLVLCGREGTAKDAQLTLKEVIGLWGQAWWRGGPAVGL